MTEVPAWRDPATRAAWRTYVARSSTMAASGAAGMAAGLVLGVEVSYGWLGPNTPSIGMVLASLSSVLCLFGTVALANSGRMWARLRWHPWTSYQARYQHLFGQWYVRNGTPTLVLDAQGSPLLTLVAVEWRLKHVARTDTVVVAGDPSSSVVVAPNPGGPLLWARAPRWTEATLRRIMRDEQ